VDSRCQRRESGLTRSPGCGEVEREACDQYSGPLGSRAGKAGLGGELPVTGGGTGRTHSGMRELGGVDADSASRRRRHLYNKNGGQNGPRWIARCPGRCRAEGLRRRPKRMRGGSHSAVGRSGAAHPRDLITGLCCGARRFLLTNFRAGALTCFRPKKTETRRVVVVGGQKNKAACAVKWTLDSSSRYSSDLREIFRPADGRRSGAGRVLAATIGAPTSARGADSAFVP